MLTEDSVSGTVNVNPMFWVLTVTRALTGIIPFKRAVLVSGDVIHFTS